MLFNEPKLLKSPVWRLHQRPGASRFSALQRAEIAEIVGGITVNAAPGSFSALQRAEIAEIYAGNAARPHPDRVSVLFNEPKLLKSLAGASDDERCAGFSALQRAEIAEIVRYETLEARRFRFSALQRAEIAEIGEVARILLPARPFQCSSTSRNC